MIFADLALVLQKLEGISSRNEMTVVLAELFSKLTPEEAKVSAYLTQGVLGPAYRAPDFGIADKMMIRALGDEAEELFKKKGDLGLVAEDLNKNKKGSPISILEVYKRLYEIAETTGEGSQEGKQNLIAKLIAEVDATSAKYIVRIILAKLRSGFSDMTVIDALSWMISGDKKNRPMIEHMYNVRADLGEIVEEVVRLGKPSEMEPEWGTPILMAKAERATNALAVWERNGECAVEYKLDGLRIQAHVSKNEVKLFSRGLENVTHMYPDVVDGLKKQIGVECILEGEMIAISPDGKTLEFKKTMNRKRKYDIEKMTAEIPLAIFLFDVLYLRGKSFLGVSNDKRWAELEKLINKGYTVKLMPRIIAKSVEDIEDFYNKALGEGMEGVVAKKIENGYTPGNRDYNWIKLKPLLDSIDVVVMGYSEGEGKRSDFGIGEFLVGVYEPKTDKFLTVTKVGSGATDEEWRELSKRLEKFRVKDKPERYEVPKQYEQDYWVEPKLVLEIVGNELSESPAHSCGYGLRFPRLVSFRDKKAEDATTVSEIEKMFKLQKE